MCKYHIQQTLSACRLSLLHNLTKQSTDDNDSNFCFNFGSLIAGGGLVKICSTHRMAEMVKKATDEIFRQPNVMSVSRHDCMRTSVRRHLRRHFYNLCFGTDKQTWTSGMLPRPVVDCLIPFYPRDAMLARVIEIATCLSVRLSVTRRYCVKTKKASGMISSPSSSPKTLVF